MLLYWVGLKSTGNTRIVFLARIISLNSVIYSPLTFLKYSPDDVGVEHTYRLIFIVVSETLLLALLGVFSLAHLAEFVQGNFFLALKMPFTPQSVEFI